MEILKIPNCFRNHEYHWQKTKRCYRITIIGSIFLASRLKCTRGDDASVQLYRQVLLVVRQVRQFLLVVRIVVSRALVETQAHRDPRRSRSAAAFSYSSRDSRRTRSAAMYSTRPMSKTLPVVVWWFCDGV